MHYYSVLLSIPDMSEFQKVIDTNRKKHFIRLFIYVVLDQFRYLFFFNQDRFRNAVT